jgi:hypothetical protein
MISDPSTKPASFQERHIPLPAAILRALQCRIGTLRRVAPGFKSRKIAPKPLRERVVALAVHTRRMIDWFKRKGPAGRPA